MPGENQDTPKVDPLDATIANLESRLGDKFKDQDAKLENFATNIVREVREIVKPEPAAKKSWMDDDEDDTAYVTKADLRNTLRDVVNEVKGETRTVAKTVVAEHSTKSSRDVQALRDHPEINNETYLKEVETEMFARVQRGRNPEDPDLFSDSVTAVYDRAVRQGRITPAHLAKRRNERDDAGEDNFHMGDAPPRKDERPSASTLAIARRMGMSEERFLQIQKIKGKSR